MLLLLLLLDCCGVEESSDLSCGEISFGSFVVSHPCRHDCILFHIYDRARRTVAKVVGSFLGVSGRSMIECVCVCVERENREAKSGSCILHTTTTKEEEEEQEFQPTFDSSHENRWSRQEQTTRRLYSQHRTTNHLLLLLLQVVQ